MPPIPTRLALLLLAAAHVPTALAQPARDEAAIAARFAEVTALAHTDDVEAAMAVTACPVEGPDGRAVAGRCDPSDAAHRARVEWQLALLRRLFPEAPAALRPIYTVEGEGGMGFHVLLFQDLPEALYALVSFVDLEGTPLFGEVQVERLPEGVAAPATLVQALDGLLAAAADPAMTPETFAPLLVKSSGDAAWTSPANAADPNDQATAERTLGRLRVLLGAHGSYEVVGFDTERESEGTWHVLLVRFDGAEAPVAFAFLPIGNTFLLGDVDG